MSNRSGDSEPYAVFLVQVREFLDPSWIEYLGDVQFAVKPDDDKAHSTVMTGVASSFGAFIGLIGRLQNLGLTVLSMTYYQSAAAAGTDIDAVHTPA